ncbi:hypothetical protein EAO71_27310 [Streptomyces sp. ms191]|uniref:hypothetical protein n=1 Tax=Streptomyces sp. ms191 TaxID=1827978 RepID=UPI0011CE16CB|nr:hypothetical protein [Streptomyces sp. ms191]TXS21411.1 hypothetical protein EAO71_27310 [Streptomyces sp. ms191]
MGAISAACAVVLAAAWLAIWIRDNHPPYRTPEQVAADVARYRADRLTQQTIADREACEAIWNLTEIPQPRKETGQ